MRYILEFVALTSFIVSSRSFGSFGRRLFRTASSCPTNNRTIIATTAMLSNGNQKRESPSAERNKEPIAQVLHTVWPSDDAASPPVVLEIASGAGVHAVYLAQRLPHAAYYPTDPDPSALASIAAYTAELPAESHRIQSPQKLTLDQNGVVPEDSPVINDYLPSTLDVILCINMVHISPWSATIGLFKLASQKLPSGGILYLYGPYRVQGTCVESNVQFEQWLQTQDPRYGIRNLEDVVDLAATLQLKLFKTVEMPANNLSVIFRKI